MKHYTLFYYIAALSLLSASCTEAISTDMVEQEQTLPVELASTYPVSSLQTHASMENGFLPGDAVGVFMADYDADGNAVSPSLKGDRAGNIKFTYNDGHWTANYQMYWKNSHTPADFYGYYPFNEQLQSITDYAFSVSRCQDTDATTAAIMADYEKSDLLWAKATKVQPTTETISLQYKHLMAGITISLQMGSGFTATEWADLAKTVLIENTILSGTVNLATGTVAAGSGTATAITPLPYNGTWRAVVIPQTIAAGKTIASVTIDGQTYQLVKDAATTYQSGKMHNITITVDRSEATGQFTFSLSADDIVAWIDDPALHDGLTYAYTIVNVEEEGHLKEAIDALFDDYSDVQDIKIIGRINAEDRRFIEQNLNSLRNVNMQKTILTDGSIGGFNKATLQHFVFPEQSLKVIEWFAFAGSNLSGQLHLPEGIEEIHGQAFFCSGLYGPITLPSTLKYMQEFMGYNDRLNGELILPEGIEYAEGLNGKFTGSLHFPSSLKKVEGSWGYSGMTGTIVIPRCMTEVDGFIDSGCSQVVFHDGVTTITGFEGAQLSGELVLPQNVKKLKVNSFNGTKISHIVFNDALRIIDDGSFHNCRYLTGTQRFAENVARVSASCFENCSALTGIVLPKNVELIERRAFADCQALSSIVCENPEPPVVCAEAFANVPKDNFTVEVPKGSVEKYREAPGWSEFKRIAEYSNFVCRPATACALNTVHTEELVLNADGPWQVERQPDWVTVSPSSGTGKTQLTLTFKQLAHDSGNRSDSIVFVMPSEDYHTSCVVSQYDYEHEEDSYLTLQKATKGNRGGIDIVFVGDGYDGEDIANGNYLNLVKEQTEHFFGLEPYQSLRDYFNVYVTFPLSQEKGVNTMNTYVNNHFGTLYGYIGEGSNDQLLTEDDDVRSYVEEHITLSNGLDNSLIILMPNSTAYLGVSYHTWYGSPISICPPSERPYPQDTRGVIQHEAGGHGFARLGDENIKYGAWADPEQRKKVEDMHADGWYDNLSGNSGLHSVPWADFVFDPRYSDFVDVYEGGLEYMRGIFRPEANSCMNYGIPYYNAPSRLSIMRRIFNYAGVGFSMDYFYEHDSKEWGSSAGARQTRGTEDAYNGSSYAGNNQHRAPQIIEGKKMADRVRAIRQRLKTK